MTNGSSQGLFVVVAVVIFGIFVAISYSLFRDTLTPSLASIFSDSTIMPTTFYLADTPYKKEYVATLPAHPSATPNFEEYTRVDDIDLSKIGDNYSEDTEYEIEFQMKTLKKGSILVYGQNSSSSKYQTYINKKPSDFLDSDSYVSSEGGDVFVTYKLKFKLVKINYGYHNGKSLLSFYSGYGTGNKVTVKNIKIRKVNE